MQPKYCLPIIKNRKLDSLEIINDSLDDYDYFEVWLDYVDGIDETFVSQLVELLGGKLIVVFRRQNLETMTLDVAQRLAILNQLQGTAALVDLDLTSQQAELDHINQSGSGVKAIVSYHNYQETPDTVQLSAIIDTMAKYRPTIYKLATLCDTREDALRLLRLQLELKARGLSVIISGMGEHGAITRIFGTLWGNEMVFAPLTKLEQSAPGQLTRRQLEIIFKELSDGRQ
jgi:3-dehydroquinate dehydratase type I